MDSGFQCSSCGEWNDIVVDASGGTRQQYIEDCQVCCKPNLLRIVLDSGSGECLVTAEPGN